MSMRYFMVTTKMAIENGFAEISDCVEWDGFINIHEWQEYVRESYSLKYKDIIITGEPSIVFLLEISKKDYRQFHYNRKNTQQA